MQLTAETIAEATGKPLFIVSVAEIGLDASQAEKNLEKMFALAGSWQAVLLVYVDLTFSQSTLLNGYYLGMRQTFSSKAVQAMETPTGTHSFQVRTVVEGRLFPFLSRKHANPVIVLLRVLEYYQGIMILTTNRITSLDIAVQSRIHLAIRYDDLNDGYKQEIFKFFLDQPPADRIRDREGIDRWIMEYGCDYKLNGRQIRNIVSSAFALARSSAKGSGGDDRLTVQHLKDVVKITKEFQEQLESITKSHRSANEVTRTGK